MKASVLALACFSFACVVGLSTSQCIVWSDGADDRNNASIDASNGTPVRFRQYSLPGTDSQETPPCFLVNFPESNVANYLAVLLYTTTSGTVCVEIDADEETDYCLTSSGLLDPNGDSVCVPVTGNQARVNVLACEQSCTENDFNFFIRFIPLSLPTDDEGIFCANVTANTDFPSSLLSISPVTATVDPNPTRATLGAITIRGSLVVLLLAAFLAKIFS